MITTDYRAISAAGAVIATFGEERLARRWARENAADWPGLTIQRVRVITEQVVVYRPRPRAQLRVVA